MAAATPVEPVATPVAPQTVNYGGNYGGENVANVAPVAQATVQQTPIEQPIQGYGGGYQGGSETTIVGSTANAPIAPVSTAAVVEPMAAPVGQQVAPQTQAVNYGGGYGSNEAVIGSTTATVAPNPSITPNTVNEPAIMEQATPINNPTPVASGNSEVAYQAAPVTAHETVTPTVNQAAPSMPTNEPLVADSANTATMSQPAQSSVNVSENKVV